MVSQRVRTSEHTARIAAPAGVVHGLLADAVRWPLLLPTPVHVERIDFDGVRERLRLWDVDGERVRSFHLNRILHPHARTVAFELEDTARPGAPTTGTWTIEADGDTHCRVTLRQDRTPERLPAPTARGHRERHGEPADPIAHLRAAAERWERLDQLLLSFEDSVHLEGPAELVYDFLHRIQDWPERLPHVDAVDVHEDVPGVQFATVEACTAPDGLTRATRGVRLCFPAAARIVFKELRTPGPIAAHTGEWSLTPDGDGVRVVCAQQVLLHDPHNPRDPQDRHDPQDRYDPQDTRVVPVLRDPGAAGGLAETRRQVRTRLGRASTETLRLAGWRARTAVRRLR